MGNKIISISQASRRIKNIRKCMCYIIETLAYQREFFFLDVKIAGVLLLEMAEWNEDKIDWVGLNRREIMTF